MILAVGDRCQFNAGPESSDNPVGNAMLLAWRGALGRHAAQTVLTCTAKEFARYSWKPVNIQSHSVCQARVHKYNSAFPYRFRSADSKTYVFLVCSFCNLLSHGFKELFLCETHTDTDLEAEPRSTTNPCDMRWFLGVCTARLFELTATRSRQTLNREELV